jgi:APA family basic amino acid/polyamine antiporter
LEHQPLKRELGLGGAVVTGLGSIVGTGAFVAIGLATGMWGDAVLWAIPLAALVAVFNGISSAFLAGKYPVAGGTYEYGYRSLNQWAGFSAGWLFLLAKTASAASAALGVALYLGIDHFVVPIGAVTLVTITVIAGIRRTSAVNTILVGVTVAAIAWFALNGVTGSRSPRAAIEVGGADILGGIAFLFVAFTGYGRIATLGEEVKDPARVIPRAVIITLAVAASLYMAIELGGRAMAGPRWGSIIELGSLDMPFVTFGAVTAMLGVLLNLILGLSRVWLAMGRRGDMPKVLAGLDKGREPRVAIVISGVLVAALTLIGDIGLAWSFSAMTVLLYYGLTNLSALAIDRRRPTAWLGLASCLFLSFFVPFAVWVTGAGLVAVGLVWKTAYSRITCLPSRPL